MPEIIKQNPILAASIWVKGENQNLQTNHPNLYNAYAVYEDPNQFYIGSHIQTILANPNIQRSIRDKLGSVPQELCIQVTPDEKLNVAKKGSKDFQAITTDTTIDAELKAIVDKTQVVYRQTLSRNPSPTLFSQPLNRHATHIDPLEGSHSSQKIDTFQQKLAIASPNSNMKEIKDKLDDIYSFLEKLTANKENQPPLIYSQLTELQQIITKLDKKIDLLTSKADGHNELHIENEELKQRISHLKAYINDLNNYYSNAFHNYYTEILRNHKKNSERIQKKLEQDENLRETLVNELKKAKEEISQLKEKINALEQEYEGKIEKVEKYDQFNVDSTTSTDYSNLRIRQECEKVTSLEETIKKLEGTIENQKETLIQLDTLNKNLQEALSKKDAEFKKNLEKKDEEYKSDLAKVQKKLEESQTKAKHLEAIKEKERLASLEEISQLKEKINVLTQENKGKIEKVEKYDQFNVDSTTPTDYSNLRIRQECGKVISLEETIKNQRETLARLDTLNKNLEEDLSNQNAESIKNLEKQREEIIAVIQTLKEELENTNRGKNKITFTLSSEVKHLKSLLEESDLEINQLKKENTKMAKQITLNGQSLQEKEKQIEDLKAMIIEKNDNSKQVEAALKEAQKKIETLIKEKTSLEEREKCQEESAEEEVESLNKQIEKLKYLASEKEKENNCLKERWLNLQNVITHSAKEEPNLTLKELLDFPDIFPTELNSIDY